MRDSYTKVMRKCRETCREKLVRDYSDLICKTVGAILRSAYVPYDWEDIQELRNDVFLALFENDCKRLKVFDSEKMMFHGWIRLIAAQTTRGKIRKKEFLELRNRRFRKDLEDIVAILRYDEDDRFDARERLRIVGETIENMSARDRRILDQTCHQWKSLTELSAEIGDSYNTIAKRLHDAKQRLKKQVEDRFGQKMKGDHS